MKYISQKEHKNANSTLVIFKWPLFPVFFYEPVPVFVRMVMGAPEARRIPLPPVSRRHPAPG